MANERRRNGQAKKIAGLRGKFRYSSNVAWRHAIERHHDRLTEQKIDREPSFVLRRPAPSSQPGVDVVIVIKQENEPDRVIPLSETRNRRAVAAHGTDPADSEPQGAPGIGDAIGSFYMAEKLAQLLGISDDELRERSDDGEFLRLRTSDDLDVWPAIQFDDQHRAPAELAPVSAALRELFDDDDGWATAFWLASPSDPTESSSRSRMELLRAEGAQPLLQTIENMHADRTGPAASTPRRDEVPGEDAPRDGAALRDAIRAALGDLDELAAQVADQLSSTGADYRVEYRIHQRDGGADFSVRQLGERAEYTVYPGEGGAAYAFFNGVVDSEHAAERRELGR